MEGQTRESRDVVAHNVGASLGFADITIERSPKADGPRSTRSGAVRHTGLVRRRRNHALTNHHVRSGWE